MDFSRISEHSSEPDLRILSRLSRFEKAAVCAVVMVGGGILALWFLPAIAAYAPPGWSRMTANTAVGLLLAATSLVLSAPGRSPDAVRFSRAAAIAVLALGCLTLAEYADLSIGIDNWLPTDASATHPGRPSPQTALGLALAGIGLLLVQSYCDRRAQCADLCALAFVALDFVLLGGYFFKAVALIGVSSSDLTSPQTLLCLVLLACTIVIRRASRGGFFAFWINGGIGSHIARNALPAIVVFPFVVFGVIEYLEKSGVLARYYSRALAVPFIVIAGIVVVGWMGRRTNAFERELRLQSLTDQLTAVFNRRGFYAVADYALRNARRLKTGFVLFYFDLDGLKKINDRHGHEVGSMAIKRFAEVLVATFRKSDVVGRIGGDEFVVLAADTSGTAAAILARLAVAVAESNAAQANLTAIGYSVGCTDVPPLTEVEIDDLISRADARMYQQKVSKSGLLHPAGIRPPSVVREAQGQGAL